MPRSVRWPRWTAALRTASALGLGFACSVADAHAAAGIVDGPRLCLAGTRSFSFNPSGAGGAIAWSVDRETVNDAGVHTRTNGILSRTGPTVSLPLPAVSGAETFYYIHAADSGIADLDTVQVFPADTKTWFTYRSVGNPDVRVYAVIPSSLSAATRVLLAMHGNSRTASSYADYWRTWAIQHDYVVLCPWYDLVGWPTTGDYQMGNVFSEDDCGGTLNPEAQWSFTIDEGIHEHVRDGMALADPQFDLWGFSGGGQHVHRFLAFKPNAPVRMAIAAGSGWYTAPDLAIDCPYGVDDPLLDLTHQDLLSWTGREMVIMVGTADTVRDADLRVTPRADAQGLNRYQRADYMRAKGLAINPATRWRRIDVSGVGHEAQPMAVAAQAVLQTATLDTPRPHDAGARLRVGPNPVTPVTMLRGQAWTSGSVVEVGVYDLAGRRVAAGVTRANNGEWRLPWSDLAGQRRIAPGIYLVRVRDQERQVEQKVMVLR